MWQPVQDSGHHGGSSSSSSSRKNPHMVVSSSSKSSSSSSSPSPFASGAVPQTPNRTMEEVWKDIALATATPILDSGGHPSPYHHHHHHPAATRHSSMANADLPYLKGMILQDFLARPFAKKTTSVQPAEERGHHGPTMLPAPPRTSPATVLSLNSGADIHCTDAAPPVPLPSHPSSSSTLTGAPFSAPLGSPCPGIIFPFCSNKKRAAAELLHQQQQLDSSDGPGGGDRRNKRMIKNRESAARSRARKQAYTNELELEVNHLTEENETLRRQHEELRAKMAAQLTRKKALQRSSTAPF